MVELIARFPDLAELRCIAVEILEDIGIVWAVRAIRNTLQATKLAIRLLFEERSEIRAIAALGNRNGLGSGSRSSGCKVVYLPLLWILIPRS